jgi:hypothetical protein
MSQWHRVVMRGIVLCDAGPLSRSVSARTVNVIGRYRLSWLDLRMAHVPGW